MCIECNLLKFTWASHNFSFIVILIKKVGIDTLIGRYSEKFDIQAPQFYNI